MKLKLDENIAPAGAALLRDAGHHVATVYDQQLSGTTDDELFELCCAEARVLLTLDYDFGNILRFAPERSAGIVVLELGGPASQRKLLDRLSEFVAVAAVENVAGRLWIVEPGRVRVHQTKNE